MRFFLLINVQRVSSSSVEVNKSIVSHIKKGILCLLCSILLVSQFTLAANIKNGNRPDFQGAMEPIKAKFLFDHLVKLMMAKNIETKTGIFGANMKLNICNDGPVTIPMNIQ